MVLGSSLSKLQGQKGGQAPGSVSGLKHRRVILLPGAEDSIWEKRETSGTGQGEGLTWRISTLFMA